MKNSLQKVNIGILGMASIARRSFIPAIYDLPEKFLLTSIASEIFTSKNKYDGFKNNVLYSSYEELIENKKIDAIYIALPNSMHFKWAKKALEKNIHVICEKPLTCSFDQTKTLIEIAIKNNLVLMETFQFRFHNQFQKILSIISNNEIGKLRSLKASFSFPPFPNKNNIRYKHSFGGGSLFDAGCYTIKIAQLILGEHLQVVSANLFKPKGAEVDIWGSACLEDSKNQVSSLLTFGFDNFYQCNIELLGQTGKLSTERIFTAPKTYVPYLKLESSANSRILKLDADDHFVKMLNYFYKIINNDNNLRQLEYNQISNQAYLIDKVREKSTISF